MLILIWILWIRSGRLQHESAEHCGLGSRLVEWLWACSTSKLCLHPFLLTTGSTFACEIFALKWVGGLFIITFTGATWPIPTRTRIVLPLIVSHVEVEVFLRGALRQWPPSSWTEPQAFELWGRAEAWCRACACKSSSYPLLCGISWCPGGGSAGLDLLGEMPSQWLHGSAPRPDCGSVCAGISGSRRRCRAGRLQDVRGGFRGFSGPEIQ